MLVVDFDIIHYYLNYASVDESSEAVLTWDYAVHVESGADSRDAKSSGIRDGILLSMLSWAEF